MAIASTRTLLPLDTFAKILGINPLHFNGANLPSSDVPNACASPFVQYAYQDHDRVGREDIAQAIADAESQISDLLNFSPIVDYLSSYQDYGHNYAPTYNTPVLRLPRGYVIEAGARAKTPLHAGAPVTYSDVDPDNEDELEYGPFSETATIIANVPAGTLANEIAVYYPGQNGDDAYEIRPLTKIVIVNNNEAHITVPTAQLVDLDRFMGLNFFPVDAIDTDNFLDTVDVYRVYTDTTSQVTYEYAPRRCNPDSSACQPTGRLYIRDARLGLVYSSPANWDGTAWQDANWCACGFPMGANVSYKAGLQGRDSAVWQRAITYYALTLLDRPMCACDTVKAMMKHWTDDLATTESSGGDTLTHTLAPGILNNPLGTTRGAIYAWRLIQRQQLGEAV